MNTYAGTGQTAVLIDNSALTSSTLDTPRTLFIDSVGNLFVCELPGRIRKVVQGQDLITTLVGKLVVCRLALTVPLFILIILCVVIIRNCEHWWWVFCNKFIFCDRRSDDNEQSR